MFLNTNCVMCCFTCYLQQLIEHLTVQGVFFISFIFYSLLSPSFHPHNPIFHLFLICSFLFSYFFYFYFRLYLSICLASSHNLILYLFSLYFLLLLVPDILFPILFLCALLDHYYDHNTQVNTESTRAAWVRTSSKGDRPLVEYFIYTKHGLNIHKDIKNCPMSYSSFKKPFSNIHWICIQEFQSWFSAITNCMPFGTLLYHREPQFPYLQNESCLGFLKTLSVLDAVTYSHLLVMTGRKIQILLLPWVFACPNKSVSGGNL